MMRKWPPKFLSSQVLWSIIFGGGFRNSQPPADGHEILKRFQNTHTSPDFLLIDPAYLYTADVKKDSRKRRRFPGGLLSTRIWAASNQQPLVHRRDKLQHPTASAQDQTQGFCCCVCRPCVIHVRRCRRVRATFSFFLRSTLPLSSSFHSSLIYTPPRQTID